MLVCSIDGHRSSSLNLVLTVHGEDGIPPTNASNGRPRCLRGMGVLWWGGAYRLQLG